MKFNFPIKVVFTKMPKHGAGALYQVFFTWVGPKPVGFGKGIRFSYGGYGSERRWYQPHWLRYRGQATHFGFGPATISLVFATTIPGKVGDWLWDTFGIA